MPNKHFSHFNNLAFITKNLNHVFKNIRIIFAFPTYDSTNFSFYLLDAKYKEEFGDLVREMEAHQQFLVAATQKVNNSNLKQTASTSKEDGPDPDSTPSNPLVSTTNEEADEPTEVKVVENRKPTTNGPVKETLLGKREELTTRERLLDETAPPADPLTT